MAAVDDAPAVCRALLQARDAEQAALERRRQLVRDVHKVDGVPKAQVAARIREALAAAGWSQDEIERVGISPHSTRLVLDRL